uniref:Macaca fascicularis brain cDNA clone: QflA-19541, similar to human mannosidase, endo-alpha (MANEA), mRNA, RefSeq: NM_024641.2 n=1 Tax=Macaca fascicularis TaxID=9541 RepID=I7GIG0_MACFA|nr:unnamed protein product [Macaca fascicularis]
MSYLILFYDIPYFIKVLLEKYLPQRSFLCMLCI